jgi:LytS/YehU family sensor histidine kinase
VQQVARNVASWILTTLPFGAVVYTTVAGVAHALTYVAEVRARDLQVGKLAEQLSHARFAALQAQVNPHFLFNTLNTITVLVRDGDRSGAVRIVEQLSDVLRRTLSPDRANEVPLADELDLVRQYLAIEQARFSDRLNATITGERSLERAAVPSFAVQHLVENAVRHGIAKRLEAGRLTVTAAHAGDSLVVTVSDDGLGLRGAASATGHGLENTRERLRALYGANASLTVADLASGGAVATLRVPFRELAPSDAAGADAAR